jgi:hypothetical protein
MSTMSTNAPSAAWSERLVTCVNFQIRANGSAVCRDELEVFDKFILTRFDAEYTYASTSLIIHAIKQEESASWACMLSRLPI